MSNNTAAKKLGRPALPPELKRTARISARTYRDIADKVARNGTEWLEAVVRRAKDRTPAG